MNKNRICNKCYQKKPIFEFYTHPGGKNGYLNQCKLCVRDRVKNREKILRATSRDFVESERLRSRIKYTTPKEKYRLLNRNPDINKDSLKRWMAKFPEKRAAAIACQKIKKPGFEKHHWSYNKIHWLDIEFFTMREHKTIHRFIIYDQDFMMYRKSTNGVLLDTKSAHMRWARHVIKKFYEF